MESPASDPFKISVDYLVRDELVGKFAAIERYDKILWEVRTGYALLLYGAVGILAGLTEASVITLTSGTAAAVVTIVLGFSLFGAMVDISFVSAKLRVVSYRDKLVTLAFQRAVGVDVTDAQIMDCLRNSGERKEAVQWSRYVGRGASALYYGGTAWVCTVAIGFLFIR